MQYFSNLTTQKKKKKNFPQFHSQNKCSREYILGHVALKATSMVTYPVFNLIQPDKSVIMEFFLSPFSFDLSG